jgi:hemerythrin-like domain-containing protein
MNVFEIIEYEHQLILDVLQLAQRRILTCVATGDWASLNGHELVDFCQGFIGRNHRQKEELLFARLLQKDQPYLLEPMAGFRAEHGQLKRQVESLALDGQRMVAGQLDGAHFMGQRLAAYIHQAFEHLEKENRFYQVVGALLDEKEHAELKTAFDQLEQMNLGSTGHDYYCQWAQRTAASGK